jgi:sterol desaturase/sphingolipid hydroxylase (fatty acid hydroxylase superfamily)
MDNSGPAQVSADIIRIRYEQSVKGAIDRSRAVVDFALLGLRGLTIVNGGALIGLITFLGHYEDVPRTHTGLWWAFGLFVVGLSFSFLAILFSYLAQTYFNWQEMTEAERLALQAVGANDQREYEEARKEFRNGDVSRSIAITCSVISLGCFFVGAFSALKALAAS